MDQVVRHQRGDHGQDDDLADILHDGDQDEHLDVLPVQTVLRFQHGHDHGCGRTGDDRTQDDGLRHVVAQERARDESAEDHERQLDDGDQYREGTLLADLLDVDLQADAEHQHDQPHILQQRDDVLFHPDGLLVLVEEKDVDQDDPCDDVSDERREFEFVENDRAYRGQEREERQGCEYNRFLHPSTDTRIDSCNINPGRMQPDGPSIIHAIRCNRRCTGSRGSGSRPRPPRPRGSPSASPISPVGPPTCIP